jgi:formiminotetrahydrofolate cyclodeaminase
MTQEEHYPSLIEAAEYAYLQLASMEDYSVVSAARSALRESLEGTGHSNLRVPENLSRERDAYKKAKQENDERFMRERDEAREELQKLRGERKEIFSKVDKIYDAFVRMENNLRLQKGNLHP